MFWGISRYICHSQQSVQNEEIQSQFFERVLQDWSNTDQQHLEQLLTRLVADFNREIQQLNQNPEVRAVNE